MQSPSVTLASAHSERERCCHPVSSACFRSWGANAKEAICDRNLGGVCRLNLFRELSVRRHEAGKTGHNRYDRMHAGRSGNAAWAVDAGNADGIRRKRYQHNCGRAGPVRGCFSRAAEWHECKCAGFRRDPRRDRPPECLGHSCRTRGWRATLLQWESANKWALPQSVWRRGSILALNSSGPARPYMARLRVFRRLI